MEAKVIDMAKSQNGMRISILDNGYIHVIFPSGKRYAAYRLSKDKEETALLTRLVFDLLGGEVQEHSNGQKL